MIAKSIPSLFTIANLFLGIMAVIFVFHGEAESAAMLVIAAMLADGLDGRVARALKVQNEFGRELDSLSDVISFGVAPAFIIYVVALQGLQPQAAAWLATAVFPICGALRLARFNVALADADSDPGHFVGLPIPAAGGILSTLALFHEQLHPSILIAGTIVLSGLMVSNIRYPNFKAIGISKTLLWLTPVFFAAAVIIATSFPGPFSKLVFVPLLLYALYGLKKKDSAAAKTGLSGK